MVARWPSSRMSVMRHSGWLRGRPRGEVDHEFDAAAIDAVGEAAAEDDLPACVGGTAYPGAKPKGTRTGSTTTATLVLAWFEQDLTDVAGNASDGVHIDSAAGAWMALVFGFGGGRDFDGRLTIDPHLPQRFRGLEFSLRFHDRQLRACLHHDREEYSLSEGDPLEVVIRGRSHRLTTDTPVCVAPALPDDVDA